MMIKESGKIAIALVMNGRKDQKKANESGNTVSGELDKTGAHKKL
jgi:hypothetical protein